MSYKKRILILMRYSILSIDAARSWKVGQKSINEYREKLFNPERLDLHENLFFNLTFQSILESSKLLHTDLTFIMFISSELPEKYKNKLYTLSSSHNFFIIKELDPSDKTLPSIDKEVVRILEGITDEDVIYATVRLDDDDAIHPSFLESLDNFLVPAYIGSGISFSCGYSGMFNGQKFYSFHEMNAINNAQGQALISKRSSNGKIDGSVSVYSIKVSHSRMHWAVPVIVDGRSPMYIRTVHEHGDFYSEEYKKKMSSSECISKEEIMNNFQINPNLIAE